MHLELVIQIKLSELGFENKVKCIPSGNEIPHETVLNFAERGALNSRLAAW